MPLLHDFTHGSVRTAILVVLAVGSASSFLHAQTPAPQPPVRAITLDEALELAAGTSEQVASARAGVERALAAERRVRSGFLPQLDGSASYDRTLASEFDGLFDGSDSGSSCTPLQVNPSASLEQRVAELERAYDCQPSNGFFGDGEDVDLPFGRANVWRVNLFASQALYTGGRLTAEREQARAQRESAELSLTSTEAQVTLDVAQAFFDAALSDRVLAIAEATYDQADRTLRQTQAQRDVGRQSEFDLLRAQVDRDTLQPDIVRRQASRRLAYLRLKQLLEIPLDTDLRAVVELSDGDLAAPARLASAIADAEAGRLQEQRTAVTQAEQEIRTREADVSIVRSQRLPSVFLQSSFGLVNYSGAPALDDFRNNWTIGAIVSMPVLDGGRIRAEERIARADVEQARQQLRLTRELASLDRESVREELTAARAAWEATAGTVRQAERAYEIAELRYREGLSTQLELSDARLLLQQAQLNRASAARDLQVARVRAALLPYLPLGTISVSLQSGIGVSAPAQRSSQPAASTGAVTTGVRQ